jgi:hypothetical protein
MSLLEGKKKQMTIADHYEELSKLSELMWRNPAVTLILLKNGDKLFRRKPK